MSPGPRSLAAGVGADDAKRRHRACRPLASLRLLWCVLASATSLLSAPARADIYGYIDAAGVTHLATEQIDAQYTLFLKSGERAPGVDLRADEPAATGVPDATLMKTRLFRRLVDQPNVARYEPLIRAAATRHGLDPQLVKAVIAVESGFEAGAVSDKGAVGLMQVLPSTGERYGVRADARRSIDAKLADPTLNLEVGTRYLADLRRMFTARPDLALAAYNAGENTVIRYHNAIPPYPETQAYVKLVDQFHAFYNPARDVPARPTLDRERLRVTIPARRNLPDPNTPYRVAAPVEPASSAPEPAPAVAVDVPAATDGAAAIR